MSQDPHPYSYDIRQQNTIALADPEAGANFTFTNPDNERYEILALNFILTTSATAANRIVTIETNFAAVTHIVARTPIVQIASQIISYQLMPGGSNFIDATGGQAIIGMPTRLLWPIGSTFRITVTNLQITDQITMDGLTYLYYKELP